MKEIKAIIQPFKLAAVATALKAIPGMPGLTVSEVKGFGRSHDQGEGDKVIEDFVEYRKKVKLEIVVADDLVARVLDTIQWHAHAGNPGDGKVFVSTVDDVVHVRTGERDRAGN